ncbi:MAG: transporter substrate-binding domain-containing protein [Chitinivibrionales bacterium]|nr:transporter substrate-binding domain-containing protein [Chitinivibrionales bacterium]
MFAIRSMALSTVFALFIGSIIFHPGTVFSEEITILAEDAFVPFSLEDGTGLSNEIVKAGFKAAGIEVKVKVFPFVRLMEMVKKGEALGGFNAVPTPITEKEYLFGKEPIFVSHMYFYYNKNNPIAINSMDDIITKLVKTKTPVGQVTGYIYPEEYEKLKAAPNQGDRLIIVENDSDDGLIKMLKEGRVKIAFMTAEVANYHIDKAKWSSFFGHGEYKWDAPLFVCFSKNNPKGAQYAASFDKGMATIKQNGAYVAITEKYNFLTDK